MAQEADSKQLTLPDRKEISLCEAVTVIVYGKASNVVEYLLDGEAQTEEQSAREKDLIARLHSAAYAGRIKFRALKNGATHLDGHKEIDRLYFSEPRGLCWYRDEVWNHAGPVFKSRPPHFTMDWRDVHLDRKDFESLLEDMGVSIQEILDADSPSKLKTYKTGLAGRPTAKHLVMKLARLRLEARDYPETLTKFSEQLSETMAKTEPQAPRMTPKTIRNDPEIRELWRRRSPKIIEPS